MNDFTKVFLKLFNHEIKCNYKNNAIIGGLGNLEHLWQTEASLNHVPKEIINEIAIHLIKYASLSEQERKITIEKLITTINLINPSGVHSQSLEPSVLQSTANFSQNPIERNQSTGINAPVTVINRIGVQIAKLLDKLNLRTIKDLLHFYPRRYSDLSTLKPINRLNYGEELSIIAVVDSINMHTAGKKKLRIIEAVVSDGTGSLRVTWFNQPWLLKNIPIGKQIILSGKIEIYLGRLMMNNPEVESIDREQLHTNRIVPFYPLTAGITQKNIRRIMFETVNYWSSRIQDYLPDQIRKDEKLIDLPDAITNIHFPKNNDLLLNAKKRLSFDEILFLQLGVMSQKKKWENNRAEVFSIEEITLQKRIRKLPYVLTKSQLKVINEIRFDLSSGKPMNRLIQGDVGSGKTVIATLAIEIVIQKCAQSAFFAPTSILAEQHFRNLSQMLISQIDDNLVLKPEEIALIIGDTPEKEKAEIRKGLASGEIKVVIGTHTLIEDPILFKWLQLVIVDEQHRFGVAQRALLRAKGSNPHLLVMSATPIPRSLALTVYGDLDLSVIDEMPVGRLAIETHVMRPAERESAYQLIQSQIDKGHQAFIIYPLIESEDEEIRKAAINEYERIQSQVFPHLRIGLMHGRLKQTEKDEIMKNFRDKNIQILISTSVIEVGLDIPNATIVLIESANRFGLAQLHQIRGRVGRGMDQSYCLLIPDIENNFENERLTIMAETNDGFKLAEYDLSQRGPGDFLGTRQSGYLGLKLASLTDLDLILRARKAAQKIFILDPDLSSSQNQLLLQELRTYWPVKSGDVS
jgi:ATP-dependent DNA helicase RecG